MVVVVTEVIKLLLEFFQAVGCGLGGEEQFQGLPKSLDFALSGGFVGASILLLDALQRQQRFERVRVSFPSSASSMAGGVNHAVICQG